MRRILTLYFALFAALSVAAQSRAYKIGDLYTEEGKRGVVFEVSNDGQHGKIVSVEQSHDWIKWCTREVRDKEFDMTSDNDGLANTLKMRAVETLEEWQKYYPAYAWFRTLGEGWYIPAVEEARALAAVAEKVNATLEQHGYKRLYYHLWTSTEIEGKQQIWMIDTEYNATYMSGKSSMCCVRAIAQF